MNNKFDERTKGLAQSLTDRVALKTFGLRFTSMVLIGFGFSANTGSANARAESAPTKMPATMPWSQLGAKAGADYKGDGFAVVPTTEGARLRCVFQRLEGEVTREGLWLSSTASNTVNDRFRIVSAAIGRQSIARDEATGLISISGTDPEPLVGFYKELASEGTVTIQGQTVRFIRPGLTEEYSVSMDGVRQDFVLRERPGGAGKLAVRLAVSGATIEPAPEGAQLVLENSGRKIAYNRLRVTDANGKELRASMEVQQTSASSLDPSAFPLVVLVDDTDTVYPIRIDPTFSDANWISMDPSIRGADSPVSAAVVDASGNLYIGGAFTVVGDVVAHGIARWNGSSWSALGSGMNDSVSSLAISGNDLYAGGGFTTAGGVAANRIAKWNGSSWSALGSGMNDSVSSLAISGSDLYAGGYFTNAGGTAANLVAKWNGTAWSALGSGMSGTIFYTPSVYALAVSGSDLYAGGEFTAAGGVPANYIAKWNGNTWTALGSGMGVPFGSAAVNALAVSGSNLYAGGTFTTAGGVPASRIAKWDGNSWSALGFGLAGDFGVVHALAASGSSLYVGGQFTMAGGNFVNRIAMWDGSVWSALGSGIDGGAEFPTPGVHALAPFGSILYVGGNFSTADGTPANCIAKWNGSNWSALGSGTDAAVYAVAVSGSDLYVGGAFTTVGGSRVNCIAKWNGSVWSALGSGMNGYVTALAVSGGDLYAGGGFTTAGGVSANYIAKWDGISWSALGSGLDRAVYALAVSGSNVYAGGDFTTAGGINAYYIARWGGSSWSALGAGIDGYMLALAVSGSDLYAGGAFSMAGGVAANNIAKWNGSSWSALGSGMDSLVSALAVSGSDVYAGGGFTSAGGSAANYIAKWNGSSWIPIGSGLNGVVATLAVSGSDLYAGGLFTTAGGIAANNIAKWNGSSWSALGSGMNSNVRALAVSGSDLYAGGKFTIAGGKVSAYAARAVLGDAPGYNQLSAALSNGGTIQFSYVGYPATNYALDRTFNLSPPIVWDSQQTNTMSISGVLMFTNTPAPGTNNFWRVRSVP